MPAVFYPGAFVRLQIRFEDFKRLSPNPVAPVQPSKSGAESFGPGLSDQITGLAAKTAAFDLPAYDFSVELNSFRRADESRATVPFWRIPFDPRIIRDATIQVFAGTFSPFEWADAMGRPGGPALVLPEIIPDGRYKAGTSNELFRGFVDTWDLDMDGNNKIQIKARDLTGDLLDKPMNTNALKGIPKTVPLDQLIQMILTGDGAPTPELARRFGVPGFRGILVVNEATEPTARGLEKLRRGEPANEPGDRKPLPTMADIRPPQWFTSKKTKAKGKKRPSTKVHTETYWDVITDLCVSAGYIVYMRTPTTPSRIDGQLVLPATEIVISTPNTYYKEDGFVDPERRFFIYGSNIDTMSISRKLRGVKVPSIEVRAFDPTIGETISARFPTTPQTNRPGITGKGEREDVKIIVVDDVSGDRAREQLLIMAQSIYQQIGKSEFEVEIETKHMAGMIEHLDDGVEADILKMRPGDTITIEVDQADIETNKTAALTLFTSYSTNERIASMEAVGIPRQVAEFAAEAMANPYVQSDFRLQTLHVTYSKDRGYKFQLKAQNYLDVRQATEQGSG